MLTFEMMSQSSNWSGLLMSRFSMYTYFLQLLSSEVSYMFHIVIQFTNSITCVNSNLVWLSPVVRWTQNWKWVPLGGFCMHACMYMYIVCVCVCVCACVCTHVCAYTCMCVLATEGCSSDRCSLYGLWFVYFPNKTSVCMSLHIKVMSLVLAL